MASTLNSSRLVLLTFTAVTVVGCQCSGNRGGSSESSSSDKSHGIESRGKRASSDYELARTFSFDDFPKVVKVVNAKRIPLDPEEPCMLMQPLVIGEYIIATNSNWPALCVFDMDGKLLGSFLNHGRAGNEALGGMTVSLNAVDSTFSYFDKMSQYKAIIYDIATLRHFIKDGAIDQIKPSKVLQFQSRHIIHNAVIFNGKIVGFSPQSESEHMLSVYNHIKDTVQTYGRLPNYKYSGFYKSLAFTGDIASDEQQSKIAVCYFYTDIIDIFDREFNLLFRLHGPDIFYPVLQPDERNGSYGMRPIEGQTKVAFKHCIGRDGKLWLSYIGDKMNRLTQPFAHHILCFDWDGAPVARYEFDKDIVNFDVADGRIFVVTYGKYNTEIFYFDV